VPAAGSDASEASCNRCEEEDDRGGKNHPYRITPVGGPAIVVDVVLDRPEDDKVDDEDGQAEEKGNEGDCRGDEISQAVGADSQEEGNGSNSGGNLVENETFRQAM